MSDSNHISHTIHHLMHIIKILDNVESQVEMLSDFCKVYYHLLNLLSFSTTNWNVSNILMYQLLRGDGLPRNLPFVYVF